jgi:hypothetical protein
MQVLEVEVDSPLLPDEFRERVMNVLNDRLEQEGVGELMEFDDDEPPPAGQYRFGVVVSDVARCRALVEEVLTPYTSK